MTCRCWYILGILIAVIPILICSCTTPAVIETPTKETTIPSEVSDNIIKLPEPQYDSNESIEQSLLHRRSIRSYSDKALSLQEISQLLWAAQGITDDSRYRTAPSAGALYPLEVYLVAGNVLNLAPGVYKYRPVSHDLVKTIDGDKRSALANAALMQSWVKECSVDIVFTAVYSRTTGKYGDRGIRYVHMEVGHAAQNLLLQAVAMDLGAVPVGAFRDEQVRDILNIPRDEQPLYIIPVGKLK